MFCDVAIIGGGPGGSTTASLLRKYDPTLIVSVFERERFPRDHVGESQLPGACTVLAEMGVWDKVEAAGFPIKLGATYRWGKSQELWDFEFYPRERFQDEPRPATYTGQRMATAFQVDRAIYDEILLNHAAELGADVHQETRVVEVLRQGDRVAGLRLESGQIVEAKIYVDASGHSGLLRRAMGVEAEFPTKLQNIAIWDYWQNAEWAVKIGIGGTYVQVLSVGYGWIWFIPLGPTRTSVGLIVPAAYYKECGKKPGELYAEALQNDERIRGLMQHATSEGKLSTTRDWSFLSTRHAGENWFLVGEAGGFADPILAAGMTMTHAAGRECAYTILEILRGKVKPEWLRAQYEKRQMGRIRNHIRFADYWYSTNGVFTDLKEFTSEIAKDAGLDLAPERAWPWLAQGGFIGDDLSIGTGTFTLNGVRALNEVMHETSMPSPLSNHNWFELDLKRASYSEHARYAGGRVLSTPSYIRDGKILPVDGVFEPVLDILQRERDITRIVDRMKAFGDLLPDEQSRSNAIVTMLSALEALVFDGWVRAAHRDGLPTLDLSVGYGAIHWHRDPPPTPA
jgi:flavin-dependent dehydrogenase